MKQQSVVQTRSRGFPAVLGGDRRADSAVWVLLEQVVILVLNHFEVFHIQRSALVCLVDVILPVAYRCGFAYEFDLLVVEKFVTRDLLDRQHTTNDVTRLNVAQRGAASESLVDLAR